MSECLALKPSINREIFYFLQPSTIIPVSFTNNEITQNIDGLIVYHEVLTDRKLWNCKEIGIRTVAACYLENPTYYVFRSAEKYEITDPGFECLA